MLRQDIKIKSNTNSQRIGLLALALTFILGCTTCPVLETDPSRYQCRTDPQDPLAWGCTKDDTRFACKKTTCKPTWCDLPLQDCGLPPLTNGTDECGFPCSKPSTQWPGCNEVI